MIGGELLLFVRLDFTVEPEDLAAIEANAASAQGTDAADGNAGMEVGENGNPGTVLERARRNSR